jgi:hypothetical protein
MMSCWHKHKWDSEPSRSLAGSFECCERLGSLEMEEVASGVVSGVVP